MNAHDIITRRLSYGLDPSKVDEFADVLIEALRADPAAVLALLPEGVRADIRMCAIVALAQAKREGAQVAGRLVLDLLVRSEPT